MKKFLPLVLTLIALALSLPAQAQLSNLHFGKYAINSIRPQSFSAVSGRVTVSVRNDTTAFVMQNIRGVIYRQGQPLVQGIAEDVSVAQGRSDISVSGQASLCEGVGLWTILSCVFSFDINDYTADVSMDIVDEKGNQRTFSENGMEVAAILNNLRSKKK